jgi:signal-transduction protein with cAMP-binding, CBS, and nucleotidyltransferase domain
VTIPSPVEFLAQVEFFSALRAEELEQIETQVQSKWYDLGETVANAGEPAESIFIVRSGMVRMFKESKGKEVSLGIRKAR